MRLSRKHIWENKRQQGRTDSAGDRARRKENG